MLADAQQDGGVEVFRVADRVLFLPDLAVLPQGAARFDLAMINPVARAPLRFEIDQAGVRDQGFIASGGRLHPVDEMAAVAGAGRGLTRAIDKRKAPDGFIGGLVDVLGGTL